MVRVRLSEPTLVTDLQSFLAGFLPADVRETRNELVIEFEEAAPPDEQLERVEALARAWRANGHLDVRPSVQLEGA